MSVGEPEQIDIGDRIEWDHYDPSKTRPLEEAPLKRLIREAHLAVVTNRIGRVDQATVAVEELLFRACVFPSSHWENAEATRHRLVRETSDATIGMALIYLAENNDFECFYARDIATAV